MTSEDEKPTSFISFNSHPQFNKPQYEDSSSIYSVSGPTQSSAVYPINSALPPIAALNLHSNLGCTMERDSNNNNTLSSDDKKLSTDIKCIKNEIKCLERAFDSAFVRSWDLTQMVSDLGNECVVNNINNDAIRDIFHDFKKDVLARLSKLETRVEILELIVDAKM
ncbi:hypothetical protein BJ165DRAFT_1409930 [Panaeolus papilionaceus]|nr:hypothetical protein BJ165DRAFT_1409930 [Panaeolus papilionaceus]